MARPRKTAAARLRVLLRARCSDAEHAAVRAKAAQAGLTVSQFVRRAVVNAKVVSPDPILALVREVGRAGVLVNQQMPIAHSRGEIPAELRRANEALEKALLAVSEKLAH